jgi:hypothetical protein
MTFRLQAWPLRALSSSIPAPKGLPMLAQSRRELDANDVARPSAGRSRRVHGVGWVDRRAAEACRRLGLVPQFRPLFIADKLTDRIGPVVQTEPTGPVHTSSPAPERMISAAHAPATGAGSLERTAPRTTPDKSRSQQSAPRPEAPREKARAQGGSTSQKTCQTSRPINSAVPLHLQIQTPIHAKLA